jgi:SAM-dependent methyltransferase
VSSQRILNGKRVLHFAPEAQTGTILRRVAASYVTADLLRRDVDMKLDISNMVSIGSDDFDVVVACDVLEHVPDDYKAMLEIYRVLRVGGCAILTVPQMDNLESTFEDKTVVDPADRERIYGQWDHLRIYGKSFPEVLHSVGFEVITMDASSFSRVMVKRHVLFPPKLSKHPLATNYRKVFFALKTDRNSSIGFEVAR